MREVERGHLADVLKGLRREPLPDGFPVLKRRLLADVSEELPEPMVNEAPENQLLVGVRDATGF